MLRSRTRRSSSSSGSGAATSPSATARFSTCCGPTSRRSMKPRNSAGRRVRPSLSSSEPMRRLSCSRAPTGSATRRRRLGAFSGSIFTRAESGLPDEVAEWLRERRRACEPRAADGRTGRAIRCRPSRRRLAAPGRAARRLPAHRSRVRDPRPRGCRAHQRRDRRDSLDRAGHRAQAPRERLREARSPQPNSGRGEASPPLIRLLSTTCRARRRRVEAHVAGPTRAPQPDGPGS